MKTGDYVTVQDIMNQDACRWVVLADLEITDDGDVVGGIIKHIEDSKAMAGEKTAELYENGITALLVGGTSEPLCVGGIIVE